MLITVSVVTAGQLHDLFYNCKYILSSTIFNEKSDINVSLCTVSAFSFSAFKVFLFLSFNNLTRYILLIKVHWASWMHNNVLHQIWDVFSHYISKYFCLPFLSFLSFWDSLVYLILFVQACSFFFKFRGIFFSDLIISIILSSR